MHQQNALRITKGITLTELAPSTFYSNTNVHLVDINVFAKFDEIPSLPVQDIKEKPKCHGQRITRAITLTELAPSPYFSIKNVHLVDINVFAKFYEILSLLFQDTEKPKRRGRMDARTDEQRENSILPNKHSLRGYNYRENVNEPSNDYGTFRPP